MGGHNQEALAYDSLFTQILYDFHVNIGGFLATPLHLHSGLNILDVFTFPRMGYQISMDGQMLELSPKACASLHCS